jgi:microcystin-dependent protein
MSTITTIAASDLQSVSRSDINTNFSNLNTDKLEKSGGTMTGLVQFSGTGHAGLKLNSLTTTQRDALTPSNGMAIYNSTLAAVQVYQNSGWISMSMHEVGDFVWSSRTSKTGYLILDGSLGDVSRATYSDLFALWSTTYGAGDGSTTFGLPKVAGRTLVAAGTGTKVATFASRATNVITVTGLTNAANNEFQTGQAVLYHSTGVVITGLADNTTYYIIRVTNTTFSLATSLANAQAGTVIALSSDGTGVQTFTLTFTARTLADTGGEENHAQNSSELLAHTHTIPLRDAAAGSGSVIAGESTAANGTSTSNSTGGNAAMNNMQPNLVENLFVKY